MAEAKKWTIRQLGGPQKVIELSGWAAPFGRERKEKIVGDGIGLRKQVSRYSGNDEPDYHIFGIQYDDWELHGRWMDYAGGPGFAKAMVQNVKSMIADAQKVVISWGDVRTVTGLLDHLEPGWESETAAAWTLKILVSKDQKLGATPTIPNPRSAESYTNRLIEAMSEPLKNATSIPPTFKPTFLDFLDSLITLINTPANELVKLAGSIDNLKNGTIAEIRRFRAGLAQYRTALTRLRTVYESAPSEFALEFQETDAEAHLTMSQAAFGSSMAEMMRDFVKADQAAAQVEKSRIKSLVVAQQGDSWESLSRRGYSGNGGRVKDILEANGIVDGSNPIPGTTYIIPR